MFSNKAEVLNPFNIVNSNEEFLILSDPYHKDAFLATFSNDLSKNQITYETTLILLEFENNSNLILDSKSGSAGFINA